MKKNFTWRYFTAATLLSLLLVGTFTTVNAQCDASTKPTFGFNFNGIAVPMSIMVLLVHEPVTYFRDSDEMVMAIRDYPFAFVRSIHRRAMLRTTTTVMIKKRQTGPGTNN